MAAIKNIKRTVALDGNSISEQLPASFFNSESTAHTFIIAGVRGGESVAFTGAVSATFLNANDAVVLVTGSIVDGAAVVTLSNDCYALSGRFTLTIDVNGATVYECQSRIKRRSSGTAYDPSGEISVATLSAEIAAMQEATAAANTAANNAAGYVDAVAEYNVFNIPTTEKSGSTRNGVTTTVTGPYSIHAEGTATANWFHNLWLIPTFPDYLKAGDTIYLLCESTQSNVSMQLLTTTDNGANWTIVNRIYGFTEYTIPAGVTGIGYRAFAASGVSVNANITAGILTNEPIDRDTILRYRGLEDHTDLDDAIDTGITMLYDANTYTNKPSGFGNTGYLFTVNMDTSVLQMLLEFSGNKLYKRRRNVRAIWSDWGLVGGGENTYNNTYNYPIYNNTYTQTVSPTITTDTNAYMAPSGDSTDRTAAIVALLNSQGVCRLGKGNYYVNNLTMPDNTLLIGAGAGTRLILSGTGDGYAVKMGDYCAVENMSILGATADITLSETLGGRHGVLWQGNYSENQNNDLQPNYGLISNLWISGFNGGGVTCYNTGYGTLCHLEAVNIYCRNCNAGINIAYWSEFHKFTNCRLYACYYGCINNGGNNMFVNCDFSSCKQAFLMDNESGQSPNNGHGSCVACVFNHTNSNSGIGIKGRNISNGFIFDGCQIFFSQIDLAACDGFVFSNCNFGANNCNITINGGGAVLFANNMHQSAPTISITDNAHVHFTNCYVRSTGAAVTA